jgi:hypothetical protein
MKTLLMSAALIGARCPPALATTIHHRPTAYKAQQPVADGSEGYRRATGFEQIKALCEAVADGRPMPGYFAYGSPTFVGTTSLAYGIGSMIRHARAYDQCMVMHGYVHQ